MKLILIQLVLCVIFRSICSEEQTNNGETRMYVPDSGNLYYGVDGQNQSNDLSGVVYYEDERKAGKNGRPKPNESANKVPEKNKKPGQSQAIKPLPSPIDPLPFKPVGSVSSANGSNKKPVKHHGKKHRKGKKGSKKPTKGKKPGSKKPVKKPIRKPGGRLLRKVNKHRKRPMKKPVQSGKPQKKPGHSKKPVQKWPFILTGQKPKVITQSNRKPIGKPTRNKKKGKKHGKKSKKNKKPNKKHGKNKKDPKEVVPATVEAVTSPVEGSQSWFKF